MARLSCWKIKEANEVKRQSDYMSSVEIIFRLFISVDLLISPLLCTIATIAAIHILGTFS